MKFGVILTIKLRGRCGIVVWSALRGRMGPGSKPDSTGDPPCMWVRRTLNHTQRDKSQQMVSNDCEQKTRVISRSVGASVDFGAIRNMRIRHGNEISDALAKPGADDASVPSAPLTYLELFSRAKSRNKTIWLIPPEYHWYQGSGPGGCLSIDCSRRDQTTLTRFLSGHIRSLPFSDNSKCFQICPKCTAEQATPDHILACLGLSQQDLVSNPLLTLDFFRIHRLMDII
ncbi:hypothetical protein AVEN_86442-1 [Araneus ventricosus]|uniref:Uncharacterized protein n=1 Tax=Araneus ventricosus TaxID=182803 RepID=A0A4Y2DFP9_ARAVE|nr:hypothetical protein AVEN_86442-1 [Araneus ventricosus]